MLGCIVSAAKSSFLPIKRCYVKQLQTKAAQAGFASGPTRWNEENKNRITPVEEAIKVREKLELKEQDRLRKAILKKQHNERLELLRLRELLKQK